MKHPPQEQDVLPGRRIAGVGIGVVIATVFGVLVAFGIGECTSRPDSGIHWTAGHAPEPPSEINSMETGLFSLQAQGIEANRVAEARLGTYGWADRDHGIVRVPIDVAIDLVLARSRQQGASR